MSEEPRKRSRFDKEPEPEAAPRKSRFDRRSRSPAPPKDRDDRARTRSPVKSTESPGGDEAQDAAARAAAAVAARINASIQNKKAPQHVDVPPIRSSESAGPPPGSAGGVKSPTPSGTLNAEIYQQDGDFIKDIEVNDLRNRYTLTKGSTQKTIKEETGADVTTRGNYYPDKSMATPANPPLYLHVTSTTKEGLEKAVKKIDELMNTELPNLIDERRFRRREAPEQPQHERDERGRRKWPDKRIPIDLEPIPGFNLRAQVVGSGGSYVKHIQQETRCRVQIKGRGSGFIEHDTNAESDEQMYLHVAGPEQAQVDAAEQQCLSLLESVKEAYEQFKERGAQRGNGGYGGRDNFQRGGDRQSSGSYGSGSAYGGASAYGAGNTSAYGGYSQTPDYASQMYAQTPATPQTAQAAQTPQQPTDPAEQQRQFEAWAAYYQANPSADPYAAYGGYAAVMAQYMQGGAYTQQASYQQPAQGAPGAPGAYGAAADDSAPPPPPPGAANGSQPYSAVPPPPGM